MRLYHCLGARSLRALWAIEELGRDCELVVMPFPPRKQVAGWMDANPLGTIPLLVDGNLRMTESSAIAQYLATGTPLAVAPREDDYGIYLDYLHHADATLTFPQTLVFRYLTLERPEKRQPQVAADYLKWFLARTALAETALADGRDYLCAGRFTVADVSVAYALLFAGTLGHLDQVGPHLRRFWDRMQAREGFLLAKAAQAAG